MKRQMKVFRSMQEIMQACFPESVEKERRASLTEEERIKEDAEDMAKELAKKFRASLRKQR